MIAFSAVLLWNAALGQAPADEPAHAANPVYRELRAEGYSIGGTMVPFPAPLIQEAHSANDQRRALRSLYAGDPRSGARVEAMLGGGPKAPIVLKFRDIKTRKGTPVCVADLWFVVNGELEPLGTPGAVGPADGPLEAAGLRLERRVLNATDAPRRVPEPSRGVGVADQRPRERFIHRSARLLNRVAVDVTDQVAVSRSADSTLTAWRTAHEFDREGPNANVWRKLFKNAADGDRQSDLGPAQPYEGGAGYVVVRRLKAKGGALLVEAHVAFAQPREWFEGGPLLRTKLRFTQEVVRAMREEAGGPAS